MIADLDARHIGADGVDNAGDVQPEAGRQIYRHHVVDRAAALLPIQRVDSRGPHQQPDLPVARVRNRYIDQFKRIGSAVAGELDRKAHRRRPFR